MLWVAACNVVATTEHGIYSYDRSCMQKMWSTKALLGLYGKLECQLYCELLLLLNMADMVVFYVEGCGMSLQCLVCVNRNKVKPHPSTILKVPTGPPREGWTGDTSPGPPNF